MLLGCVPITGHYFEPSTPGGVVYKHDCHGKLGAESDIKLVHGSVNLLLSTKYVSSSELSISMVLGLKQGDHVFVNWSEMKALNEESRNIPVGISGGYTYDAGHVQAVDATVVNVLNGEKFEMYEVDAKIEGELPNEFVLIFPPMTINGTEYPATKITFNKRFGAWLFPINC